MAKEIEQPTQSGESMESAGSLWSEFEKSVQRSVDRHPVGNTGNGHPPADCLPTVLIQVAEVNNARLSESVVSENGRTSGVGSGITDGVNACRKTGLAADNDRTNDKSEQAVEAVLNEAKEVHKRAQALFAEIEADRRQQALRRRAITVGLDIFDCIRSYDQIDRDLKPLPDDVITARAVLRAADLNDFSKEEKEVLIALHKMIVENGMMYLRHYAGSGNEPFAREKAISRDALRSWEVHLNKLVR